MAISLELPATSEREHSPAYVYSILAHNALIRYNALNRGVSPVQLLFGSCIANVTAVHCKKSMVELMLCDIVSNAEFRILCDVDSPVAGELRQRLGL